MLLIEIYQKLPNIQPQDTMIRGAKFVNLEPGEVGHPPRVKVYLFGDSNPRNIQFKIRKVDETLYDEKDKNRKVGVYKLDQNLKRLNDALLTIPNSKMRKDVQQFVVINVNTITRFWHKEISKEEMLKDIKPIS